VRSNSAVNNASFVLLFGRNENVTIAGPILAKMRVATSGTDSDFIVKIIDVYPDALPNDTATAGRAGAVPHAARDQRMRNYQMLVGAEVIRGKYRRSLTKPEPMVPNQVTPLEWDLRDKNHTFQKGHRIMVQVQSSWFPLIDRNPHQFMDIYKAKPSDLMPELQGRFPIRVELKDLTKDDFVLLEGGRPQPIVAFEARQAPAAEAGTRAAEQAAIPQRVVSNVGARGARGRVLVLLIDDLGLTPTMAQQLGPSLAGWIREKAEPTDEITIQTTSGDLWWSADVGAGRDDLVAVLDRLRGKRSLPSSTEWISDVEAYQIVVHESHAQAAELESSKGDKASITVADEEPSPPSRTDLSASVLDRVATRFLEAKSCFLVRAPRPAMYECKQMAMMLAEHAYATWTRRAGAVLDLVARVSADVAGLPGRKAILLVSDDFLRDVTLEHRFRDAVDTAQRSNTALYFSRAPIPFTRDGSPAARAWRHVGLYVYRRDCLLQLASLPPTELERSEALEQLRALEHGIRILAVETNHDSIGVDTPEDLDRVRRLMDGALRA